MYPKITDINKGTSKLKSSDIYEENELKKDNELNDFNDIIIY